MAENDAERSRNGDEREMERRLNDLVQALNGFKDAVANYKGNIEELQKGMDNQKRQFEKFVAYEEEIIRKKK